MKMLRSILTLSLILAFPFGRAAEMKKLVDGATASLLTGPDSLRNLVVGVVRGGESSVNRYNGAEAASAADSEEFTIASVTKPFTGLLLARMVASGKLRYEEAVRPCTDDVTTATCFKGTAITFLQLVTHYSGLPVTPTDYKGGRYTMADLDHFLEGYKLTRAPGTQFEYSTVGYALLGEALAARAGAKSFENLLTDEVLRPLGLSHTRFNYEGSYAAPSGNLISTVEDLLRFVTLNLDPVQAGDLGPAIRLTQISDVTKPSIPPSIAARGWHVIQPMGYHWHSGVAANTRAFVAFDLKTSTGVVMLTKSAIPPTDSRLEMAGFSILGALATGN
jgi:D-alanyl-D-alanine-carboxypeptidase/D-alanyl-D-alanine-endopeptidase